MSRRAPLAALGVMFLATVASFGYTAWATQGLVIPRAATTMLEGDSVQITLSAGSRPVLFQVVAGEGRRERPVYVYVDPTYPVLQTSLRSVKGIYDHLSISLLEGGWTPPVARIDAAGLARVMAGESSSIVVVAAGAMPDTVLGPNRDFGPVRNYLTTGGELIFIGDGLFYWSGAQGQTRFTLTDRRGFVGWSGEQQVLGVDLVHNTAGDPYASTVVAPNPSRAASDLGMGYQLAGRGASLPALKGLGGWDAGWDSAGQGVLRTSVAVLPVGQGRLVLFGGVLASAETLVADDIARLLLSGTDVAPPLASAAFLIPHLQTGRVNLPIPSPTPKGGVRLLVFDRNGFTYFHRTFLAT